jgi:hypothetical protein
MVNVGGGENWDTSYAGGGPVESVSQVVKSIMNQDGISIGANSVVLGMDLLGALESPFRTIAGSVVGWLIEHVKFMDDFLDVTAGDPAAVEAAVGALNDAAGKLDRLAADHVNALSEVPTYVEGGSGSFNAFFGTVMPRAEDIKARSLACVGQAGCVTLAGSMVSATRSTIRDALTELVLVMFERGAQALAMASYTGGASIGLAIQDVVLRAVHTASELSEELGKLAKKLLDVSWKLNSLQTVLEGAAKNTLNSFAKGADTMAKAPEFTEYDKAAASRRQPEPQPGFPWRVQGTLDDG